MEIDLFLDRLTQKSFQFVLKQSTIIFVHNNVLRETFRKIQLTVNIFYLIFRDLKVSKYFSKLLEYAFWNISGYVLVLRSVAYIIKFIFENLATKSKIKVSNTFPVVSILLKKGLLKLQNMFYKYANYIREVCQKLLFLIFS